MSIIDVAALAKLPRAKSISWANGCWDLFTPAHARLLQIATRFGSSLIVGVNSDESVRRSKGFGRPIYTALERAQLVGLIRGVTHVVIFDDDTPIRCLNLLKPDVVCKGDDHKPKIGSKCIEESLIKSWGGRVIYVPRCRISTTDTIGKIQNLSPGEFDE